MPVENEHNKGLKADISPLTTRQAYLKTKASSEYAFKSRNIFL